MALYQYVDHSLYRLMSPYRWCEAFVLRDFASVGYSLNLVSVVCQVWLRTYVMLVCLVCLRSVPSVPSNATVVPNLMANPPSGDEPIPPNRARLTATWVIKDNKICDRTNWTDLGDQNNNTLEQLFAAAKEPKNFSNYFEAGGRDLAASSSSSQSWAAEH